MAIQLDDLDQRLLDHFSTRFPKPETLSFCDYDVGKEEVVQLCGHPRAFEVGGLLETFVGHNRLGMFGDWHDFPPFAGDVAVICRRRSLMLEYDLAFFHLHISQHGFFDDQDFPILKEWTEDILLPWRRPLERDQMFWWAEHAVGYLALYSTLGGDADFILVENIDQSVANRHPTEFIKAINKEFLTEHERVDEDRIWRHFAGIATGWDNQRLPTTDFVTQSSVENVISAIKAYEGLISMYSN